MMLRFTAFLTLLMVLTACVPALQPTHSRADGVVTVSVLSVRPVYDASIMILGASTSDERCTQFDTDLACDLGDLPANGLTTITVVPGDGLVYCVAYAYLSADLSFRSYRPFACSVR